MKAIKDLTVTPRPASGVGRIHRNLRAVGYRKQLSIYGSLRQVYRHRGLSNNRYQTHCEQRGRVCEIPYHSMYVGLLHCNTVIVLNGRSTGPLARKSSVQCAPPKRSSSDSSAQPRSSRKLLARKQTSKAPPVAALGLLNHALERTPFSHRQPHSRRQLRQFFWPRLPSGLALACSTAPPPVLPADLRQ